jgi:hypothetical protein
VEDVTSRFVRRLDLIRRRHGVLGLPWAVVRKYADDDDAPG